MSQNAENGILGLQKYQNFLGEHTLRLLFSLIPWATLIHTCCQATSIFIENTGSNNDIFNLLLPSQIIKIAFCQEPLGTQLQYNIHGFQACGQL